MNEYKGLTNIHLSLNIKPEFYERLLVPMGAEIRIIHFKSPSDLIKRFGTDNISNGDDPLEQVPVALAFFYIEKGDPTKTMIAAANFGRDADTITSFAGSIAGLSEEVRR